jgi:GDPmannose 4,6-dehydratase
MLQQPQPDDYVIATGEQHTVQEVVELAFDRVGVNWRDYVRIDPALKRPAEVDALVGNAGKARTQLGWSPTVSFHQLIEMMVDADLAALRTGRG